MISYFGLFVLDFIVYFVIFKLKKIYTVRQWGSKPVGAERLESGGWGSWEGASKPLPHQLGGI